MHRKGKISIVGVLLTLAAYLGPTVAAEPRSY